MKISVIVPCYNVGPWIKRCLESILAQSYEDLEIIAIDDGSTDETGGIIDYYAEKDPRVLAVHRENAGLVAAREKGIELCSGDYVGFVDGDDAIEPDMYERLMKNALKYEADISHCGVSFLWPDGREERHYGTGRIAVQDNFEGLRDLLLGEQMEPSLCNKLYKKEIMKDSCLDTSVLNNEDLLRNFTLFSRAERSVYEDFCGYRYYQREGSMSKDSSKVVKTFSHIEKARSLITENAGEKVYPFAKRCLLSLYVNFVNQNFGSKDPEIKKKCGECREILKKEKKNLHYLIKRQQLAAKLIIYAPWLHMAMYKIYDSRR